MLRVVGVSTKHGKDSLVAKGFFDILPIETRLVEIDTDRFGTFAGEIPRPLSPIETARAKCAAGIEISGLSQMIASEGSFSPHPAMPLLTLNTELLIFADSNEGIEVVQTFSSTEIVAFRETISKDSDFGRIERAADLPHHALILREESEPARVLGKGIRSARELRDLVERNETSGELVAETDFRAMMSPSRQRNIIECARLLAQKLATKCPDCQSIGWGIVDYEKGLPCSDCGARANREVSAEVFGCPRCDHTEKRLVEALASPANCDFCNP